MPSIWLWVALPGPLGQAIIETRAPSGDSLFTRENPLRRKPSRAPSAIRYPVSLRTRRGLGLVSAIYDLTLTFYCPYCPRTQYCCPVITKDVNDFSIMPLVRAAAGARAVKIPASLAFYWLGWLEVEAADRP